MEETLADHFLPFEIDLQRVQDLLPGQHFFIVDGPFKRGQGIRRCAITDKIEETDIQAAVDLLLMEILSVLHAQIV